MKMNSKPHIIADVVRRRFTLIKFLVITAILSLGSAVHAENLIVNSNFEAGNLSFPPYWAFLNRTGGKVEYFKAGGPQDRPYVRLSFQGTKPEAGVQETPKETKTGATHLCQTNLYLVKGETYRLSAWFRTRNLKGKYSGIRVGYGGFPAISFDIPTGANTICGLPVLRVGRGRSSFFAD